VSKINSKVDIRKPEYTVTCRLSIDRMKSISLFNFLVVAILLRIEILGAVATLTISSCRTSIA
jgi:hypothetical protein